TTGDHEKPLYDLPLAIERIRAARSAIDTSNFGVLLTARAECFLVGHSDPLREAIRRLQAYVDAGADVLYAPGVRQLEEIRAIVTAVSPKPVNVLMSANTGLRVGDLARGGGRPVRWGSSLPRPARTRVILTAIVIAHEG